MKAITVTQPWATLIALEAKRVETRSWRSFPAVEGPLAIHAAAGLAGLAGDGAPRRGAELIRRLRELCSSEPFATALAPVAAAAGGQLAGVERVLPRGAIIAVAHVQGVEPAALVRDQIASGRVPGYGTVGQHESHFGDYRDGRLAIFLHHVVALPTSVPCTGQLGLWDVPHDVERAVRHQLHLAYERAAAPLGFHDDEVQEAVWNPAMGARDRHAGERSRTPASGGPRRA